MFSEKEKIAIVSSLIEMANIDRQVTFDELVTFNMMCERLHIDRSTFELGKVLKCEYAVEILKKMSDEKKISFSKMLVEMIDADERVDARELRLLNEVCTAIGVDAILDRGNCPEQSATHNALVKKNSNKQ